MDAAERVDPVVIRVAVEAERPARDDQGKLVIWFDSSLRSTLPTDALFGKPNGREQWGAAGSAWMQNLLHLCARQQLQGAAVGLRFLAGQGAYKDEGLSGESVRRARDRLLERGFASVMDGYRSKSSDTGVASLLLLTPKGEAKVGELLRTLEVQEGLTSGMLRSQCSIPGTPFADTVNVKAKGTVDKRSLERLESEVRELNQYMLKHEVHILIALPRKVDQPHPGTHGAYPSNFEATYLNTRIISLPPTHLLHTRKFDRDLSSGGRLYARYQNLRRRPFDEEERAWAEDPGVMGYFLDKKPSVEVDVRCLHPRLIYHLARQAAPADAYDPSFNGVPAVPRSTVKRALNALLNSEPKGREDGRSRAVKALTDARPSTVDKHGPALAKRDAEFLIDSILCRQPVLEPWAFKGAWRELQHLDSRISLQTMRTVLASGVPILGYHDSWIVPRDEKDLLIMALQHVYMQVVGVHLDEEALKCSDTWTMPDYGHETQLFLATAGRKT
jgi:hypothetical protein